MKVLVVGNGVAAAGFLHAARSAGLACEHMADSSTAPVCSLNSTAVAALRGTVKGLSPLGDELVDGWAQARAFYESYAGPGVERATLTTAVFAKEKNLQRFAHLPAGVAPLGLRQTPQLVVQEDAWLIHPAKFLEAFTPEPQFVVGVTPKNGRLVVTLLGGEERAYDHVVLATGQWMSWLRGPLPVPALRAVQGSFYQWDNVSLGGESFAFTLDDVNLVYHAREQRFLLGATSVKDATGDVPDHAGLKDLYQRAQGLLERVLPDPSRAVIRTGIRSVAPGRRPLALEPLPGLHLIGGLYKNGWVMAWPLGRATLERII